MGHFPNTATLQTARGLIRLYARLKGEQWKRLKGEACFIEADQVGAYMAHIAALMPLLNVNFVPANIKPVRTRLQVTPMDYGDIRGGILKALKKTREWMTYAEVADAVLAAHHLTLPPARYRHFLQKLREAMFFLKREGAVLQEKEIAFGQGEQLQRWMLSPTMFPRRR